MKKHLGLVFAIGLFAALGAQGAIVTCASLNSGTLADLITATTGTGNGCRVDDKVFTNVSYTGSGPAASGVTVDLIANSITQSYGWSFLANFTSNFTLGYTVSIDTGVCASCRITSAIEQIIPGQNPPGTQAISVNEGGIATVNIDNSQTDFSKLSGGAGVGALLSLTKTATSSGLSATASIESFESLVRQTAVPEPMTLSLMGVGLLGLGLLRKRIG